MKCYIGTYYKYNNYGTRLQNYALCSVLKSENIEPITLYLEDINNKYIMKKYVKNFLVYLPCVTQIQKILINEKKKEKKFNEFNNKLCLKKVTKASLKQIDFSNSFAIAGSDQIWAPDHFKTNYTDMSLFFLQFISEEKRYAYAPSFGVDEIPFELKSLYKENLTKFKKLSIREEQGKKILFDLLNKDVLVMPDPVFLMTKNEWREKLGYNNSTPKESYVLTYFLGLENKTVKKEIKDYCKLNNYKLINMCGNYYDKKSIIPSPDEFVELIDKAEIVITDSFHASAFSIIMGTKFIVLQRNDVKQFSRIKTLLKKFNIESNYMEVTENVNLDEQVKKIATADKKNVLIEKIIGMNFLKSIILDAEVM